MELVLHNVGLISIATAIHLNDPLHAPTHCPKSFQQKFKLQTTLRVINESAGIIDLLVLRM